MFKIKFAKRCKCKKKEKMSLLKYTLSLKMHYY